MSEGYLMKRVSQLNQLPLKQHTEGRHWEITMLHSNSACFKLTTGPGSAWWLLAPHISQDGIKHPPLRCEHWFLSNTGTVQSVPAAVWRVGSSSMLGECKRLWPVPAFLPDSTASAVRDWLPIKIARFWGLKRYQNGVLGLAWLRLLFCNENYKSNFSKQWIHDAADAIVFEQKRPYSFCLKNICYHIISSLHHWHLGTFISVLPSLHLLTCSHSCWPVPGKAFS